MLLKVSLINVVLQIKDKENLSLPLVKSGGLQDNETHDMKKASKDSLV